MQPADKMQIILDDLRKLSSVYPHVAVQKQLTKAIESLEEIRKDMQDIPESGPNPTILIAEDEPTSQAVLNSYMQSHGFNTICVVNGKEAEKIIMDHACDIALLDLQMPVQDGLTTLSNIRYQEHCPVIITTAYIGNEHKNTAMLLGAADFMSKPINFNIMLRKITQLLQGRETLDI